jgi:hypothetical protein
LWQTAQSLRQRGDNIMWSKHYTDLTLWLQRILNLNIRLREIAQYEGHCTKTCGCCHQARSYDLNEERLQSFRPTINVKDGLPKRDGYTLCMTEAYLYFLSYVICDPINQFKDALLVFRKRPYRLHFCQYGYSSQSYNSSYSRSSTPVRWSIYNMNGDGGQVSQTVSQTFSPLHQVMAFNIVFTMCTTSKQNFLCQKLSFWTKP